METDQELYMDIMKRLEFEPGINPANLAIAVHDGIVTIGGIASSYPEKRLVENTIRRIDGVKAIANEIDVELATSWTRPDPEIAKTAVHALEWDLTLPKEKLKISVEKGKLTLTGEVEWWYQKENAEKDVQDLPGVVSVDNQIEVRPTMPITNAIEVKAKIKDEFGRSALIDAENINVEVDGTTVILKGHVRSWAEFKEAADVAWSIPGITHVDNQIIIGI